MACLFICSRLSVSLLLFLILISRIQRASRCWCRLICLWITRRRAMLHRALARLTECMADYARRLVLNFRSSTERVRCWLDKTSLFRRLLNNECHVLHQLLPEKTNCTYSLRSRQHNRQLTRKSTHINDSLCFIRMLYKDAYWRLMICIFISFCFSMLFRCVMSTFYIRIYGTSRIPASTKSHAHICKKIHRKTTE